MNGRFSYGFTVVELLIVVILVGILASVTTFAYRGVQNRGYDTAVQADLAKLGEAMNNYYVNNKHYPNSDSELASVTGVTLARTNYDTSTHAVQYCSTINTGAEMLIIAQSKSGKVYSIASEDHVKSGQYPDTYCGGAPNTMYRYLIYNAYTYTWLSNF